ncbi:hypothetical protein THRCLA_09721 [Thraustotheca clavata]|uniref:Crinkler (CRN) family protein n=1 Tax=Thraustotheca clavata TaxID=74557 RepID=A0A1V9YUY8_9STRA|nr:hypothetical protein THRCLA_09721 [Thraustotheca clavata]
MFFSFTIIHTYIHITLLELSHTWFVDVVTPIPRSSQDNRLSLTYSVRCIFGQVSAPLILSCMETMDTKIFVKEDASGIKNIQCAALITNEALHRSSNRNHPFREQLRADINSKLWTPHNIEFDEELFRQAAENEPNEGKKYLDCFTELKGVKYKF